MSSSNLSPTSRFVTTPARCVCAGHHFFVFFLGQLDFGSSKDRRTDRQTHWFNLLYNPGILFDSFIISEFKRLYGKKKWGEWEKGHKSDFEIVGYSSGFLRLAMTFYEPGQTLFSSYVGTMAIPSSSSSSWTIRFVSSWTDRFSSFSSCWIFLVSGIFRLIHHHFHNFFFSLPPSFFIAFISSCCPDSRGGRDSTVPAIGGDVPHRLVLFSPLHFSKRVDDVKREIQLNLLMITSDYDGRCSCRTCSRCFYPHLLDSYRVEFLANPPREKFLKFLKFSVCFTGRPRWWWAAVTATTTPTRHPTASVFCTSDPVCTSNRPSSCCHLNKWPSATDRRPAAPRLWWRKVCPFEAQATTSSNGPAPWMCKSIAICLFLLFIMTTVIIDHHWPNISGALVCLLSSPFSNILGIRLVPKKDDLFYYFLFLLGKMSPTFRWFRVVVYFVVMDPVRLKKETHTSVREWEMRALCANRSRRIVWVFLFLVICTFHFFLGCVYRQRWRIFIWYLHLSFFFPFWSFSFLILLAGCLFGLHSGEIANWHKMKWASSSSSISREK